MSADEFDCVAADDGLETREKGERPVSVKRYRTIVADPPWPITWTGGSRRAGDSSGSKRVYEKRPLPYSVMSIEDICALDVESLADPNAHLFMWTLDRFLIDGSATRVCRAWGFEPLPRLIVWAKASAGLGRHVRPAHEVILMGRRGDARLNECAEPSVQRWRQPYVDGAKAHSAKPDGALDFIEALSPGPYVELFARRARFGWDYAGDGSLGTVSIPGLREPGQVAA